MIDKPTNTVVLLNFAFDSSYWYWTLSTSDSYHWIYINKTDTISTEACDINTDGSKVGFFCLNTHSDE